MINHLHYEEFCEKYFNKVNRRTGRTWEVEDIIDLHPGFDEELFNAFTKTANKHGLPVRYNITNLWAGKVGGGLC